MSKIKRVLALCLAVSMAVGMAACSGNSSSTNDAASSGTSSVAVGSRDATIRFSWWGGDARTQATLMVIKQFEAKYPKIHIQAEYGSADGYNDKLATQLSAGTAPDIVQVDPAYLPTYLHTKSDYFVDYSQYKIDLSGFDAKFLKQNGNFNGKQYGLPTGVAGYSLIVNSGLASKAGIDLTKQYTWDDMIAMGQKVKSYDKNCYLLATNLATTVDVLLRPYLQQSTGNTLLVDSTKKLGVTKDQMTEVLTLIKKLYDNNVIAPESHMSAYEGDNMQKDPYWVSGKYVAAYCVSSTIGVMAAANKNATYVPGKLPVLSGAKNQGYVANCPQYMCVTSKSQYAPEAVAFLDYFYNNKDAAKTLGITRSIPAVKSSREVCEQSGLIDVLTQGAVNNALSYNGTNDCGYSTSSEVKSIMQDTVSSVAYGKSEPAAAADKALTLLTNYLASQK